MGIFYYLFKGSFFILPLSKTDASVSYGGGSGAFLFPKLKVSELATAFYLLLISWCFCFFERNSQKLEGFPLKYLAISIF